jgi:hypothetical protein
MKRNTKTVVVIVASVVMLIFFLAPIVPLGGYGAHYDLPQEVFIHTACFGRSGCPIDAIEGQSYVSISFSLLRIGEYLFVNTHVPFYIWAFVW